MIEWAQQLIGRHVDATGESITAFCKKPKSTKRLHETRRNLARLRAVLEDFGAIAGVSDTFSERIARLHRRAGKVRDADVLLKRVEDYCEDASGEEREQLARLRDLLRKRAKKMRRKLTRELRS